MRQEKRETTKRAPKAIKHTPEGVAATELVHTILQTYGRIVRFGDELLSDLNITGARWQVLGPVKKSPKTVAQIARHYEMSRQLVLWHVQALMKDGIVELATNPDHKRAKLVQLTARGRLLYEEIDRRQQSWSNQLGAALDLDRVRSTKDCVRQLGELLMGQGKTEE